MVDPVLADASISISDLKKNPSAVIAAAEGPVAILDRNTPSAYLVPAKAWEELMDRLEDFELAGLLHERAGEEPIAVGLGEI